MDTNEYRIKIAEIEVQEASFNQQEKSIALQRLNLVARRELLDKARNAPQPTSQKSD